jgi:hypothetical protein
VKVENTSSQDLYSRAKLFVADAFKSSKDVTQLSDDVAKTILIKGNIGMSYAEVLGPRRNGYVGFQLLIECKDNRYRYTIDGLVFKYVVTTGFTDWSFDFPDKAPVVTKKQWLVVQGDTDTQMNIFIKLLKKSMEKSQSDF